MKKFFIIIAAVAVAASCSKNTDTFGPTPENNSNALELYMLAIADDGVATALSELESALQTNAEGTVGRYFYTTNGIPLGEDGSSWTINREGTMCGAVMKKVSGESAWTISFDGDLTVASATFPTVFTIKATKKDPAEEGHVNWDVTFDGTRTEDNGYKCTFSNIERPIEYRTIETSKSWEAFGYLIMTVFKNSEQIDKIIMELNGRRSSASLAHIK